MRRFFGEKKDNKIILRESELQHVQKVLRMKEGDNLIAFCNDEYEYICIIEHMDKKECLFKIESKKVCEALPKVDITLFQALPKKEYFDSIIAKSIEIGVNHIQPFTSAFTAVKELKMERINQQVITACKQCERTKLVEVKPMIKFKEMLKLLKNFEVIIFANEGEEKIKFSPNMVAGKRKIAVIIGAEAGFSEDERKQIIEHGATSITLGKRILRNDTACVSVLTLVSIFSDN